MKAPQANGPHRPDVAHFGRTRPDLGRNDRNPPDKINIGTSRWNDLDHMFSFALEGIPHMGLALADVPTALLFCSVTRHLTRRTGGPLSSSAQAASRSDGTGNRTQKRKKREGGLGRRGSNNCGKGEGGGGGAGRGVGRGESRPSGPGCATVHLLACLSSTAAAILRLPLLGSPHQVGPPRRTHGFSHRLLGRPLRCRI